MNIAKKDQDNIFWFFLIPIVVFVTLFISLSPWLLELVATPADRVFSGINRWSTDYFIYLSYIEQGRRGLLAVKLLLTTVPHTALYSHLVYTIPGFIFGHLFGLGSIFIYHLFRALYGLGFLWMVIVFFYFLSKNKTIALTAFFLTFYIAGNPHSLGWLQEQNIISRATGPLHYSAGFIVFIVACLYFFYSNVNPIKKTLIFGILLNLLLLTNPFNYQLILFCFGVYLGIKLLFFSKDKVLRDELKLVIISFILTLPLFLYFYYFLSTKPWGVIGVSPKFYVITTPPVGLWETALSVGPIFFLGVIGMIIYIVGVAAKGLPTARIAGIHRRSTDGNEVATGPTITIFLIIWPTIQFFLLFFGNQLKIHPPRAFSGLYYLPLAYFSALLIYHLFKNKQLLIIIYSFLFILTLPNFILFYKQQLYAFTDFKTFSPFTYPTKQQVEAYQFLEKNTRQGAGVLAMFEVSNHLMGFSGNSVELNLDHQTKSRFYAHQMTEEQAHDFLRDNHFHYVYAGFQELSTGNNFERYPFLNKIFDNQDVKIYQVD